MRVPLRQPLIMSYIITGILVGPVCSISSRLVGHLTHLAKSRHHSTALYHWSRYERECYQNLGRVSLDRIYAAAMVGFTGHMAALILGFSNQTAIVLGLALFFSSIAILKALSDNCETSRLYGQIAIGVILLDDVVATFALVVVAALATSGSLSFGVNRRTYHKSTGSRPRLYIVGGKIMPRFGKFFASSQNCSFYLASHGA